MNGFLNDLPKPFFVLAPMDDVTDTVLRQIIADCSAPDIFFTEFVNVDGLQSKGRKRLLHKLAYTAKETPLIAQIWGKTPKHFETTASELVDMGFAGVDINMGCPDKSITKNGCCSALINNRELALDIINAVKQGVRGRVPVSVKTRTGWQDVDFSWPELLLRQQLDMLTIHGRTKAEMSKVPARWHDIGAIRKLRDDIAPKTLIIGNGDVQSREQGEELARKYQLDGIMIGRGIFSDPYIFSQNSPWATLSQAQKLHMYIRHIELFIATYPPDLKARNWESLKRMAKVYVHGIDGASAFRSKFMPSKTPAEMIAHIQTEIAQNS